MVNSQNMEPLTDLSKQQIEALRKQLLTKLFKEVTGEEFTTNNEHRLQVRFAPEDPDVPLVVIDSVCYGKYVFSIEAGADFESNEYKMTLTFEPCPPFPIP